MRCASIISGSKANCFYVESEGEAILVDTGLSFPKVEQSFAELNIDPNKIKGILITHEHEDHVRHLKRIASSYRLPVYLTQETLNKTGLALKDCHIIKAGDDWNIGEINIHAFKVLHDSDMCLGFNFMAGGKKVFYASDIGSYDDEILKKAENAHFIGIEANYEPSMLRACGYPQHLKDRISGGAGHLSNPESLAFVKDIASKNTRNVMFLHISENSNCTSHIERMIDQDLHHYLPEVRYIITNRHTHGPLIEV